MNICTASAGTVAVIMDSPRVRNTVTTTEISKVQGSEDALLERNHPSMQSVGTAVGKAVQFIEIVSVTIPNSIRYPIGFGSNCPLLCYYQVKTSGSNILDQTFWIKQAHQLYECATCSSSN